MDSDGEDDDRSVDEERDSDEDKPRFSRNEE
jgi:hypothetical protein